jgi:hypothetical protein
MFFFVFISKKASENKPKSEVAGFWLKFWLFSVLGCLAGVLIFRFIRTFHLMPEVIEGTVLAHAGGFIGFVSGAVYILVSHETKKN